MPLQGHLPCFVWHFCCGWLDILWGRHVCACPCCWWFYLYAWWICLDFCRGAISVVCIICGIVAISVICSALTVTGEGYGQVVACDNLWSPLYPTEGCFIVGDGQPRAKLVWGNTGLAVWRVWAVCFQLLSWCDRWGWCWAKFLRHPSFLFCINTWEWDKGGQVKKKVFFTWMYSNCLVDTWLMRYVWGQLI